MNKKDLDFIDLARSLAAFFMIFTHVVGLYSTTALAEKSLFGQMIGLLGESPAAPVFMVAMGILFTYKPKDDFQASINRGFKLLIKGYLLNIARVVLPAIIFSLLYVFNLDSTPEIIKENETSSAIIKIINSLVVIDILQLAGLSYIVLTLFQKLKIKNYFIVVAIILISICSPFLWGLGTSIPLIGRILDPFWGVGGEQVSFPLFPWLVYPLLGMILGSLYRNPEILTKRTMQFQLALGGVLMGIGFIIASSNWKYHFGDYWRTGPGGLTIYLGFVLAWLAFLFLISNLIPQAITDFMRFISRNITNFYIVQWLLISSGLAIIGETKLGFISTIVAISIVTTLTIIICQQLQKRNIQI